MNYQIKKKRLIISIIAAAGVLLGYFMIINNNENEITIDGLRPKKNIAEFSRDADTIVIGTVKEERSAVQDSVTGYIYRNVIITPEQFLKNPLASSEVIVNLYGGKVGNVEVTIGEGETKLIPGERVLLFLGNDTITKEDGDFWIYAAPDGKLTLDTKGNAVGSEGEKQSLGALERIIAERKNDQKPAIVCNPALANIDLPEGYTGPDAHCFKKLNK